MPNAAAEKKKAEGNAFFKAQDFAKAVQKYGEAIEIDPTNHTYWSNRSASYAGLNDWENSAKDAEQCIMADKSFVKGYFRLAQAKKNLNQLDAAAVALKRGLAVEPRNADLKAQLTEIEGLLRVEKVKALTNQAEEQLMANDWAAAIKTAEAGLRLDSDCRALQSVVEKAKPKHERAEKSRRSGLSKTEMLKEVGDDFYKAANFEKAIEKYTECLDSMSDHRSPVALKCYSNRSACYKQLSNFDGVIGDSTMVLEVEPNNVKALMRRAQAFEAIERYKSALQDTRTVLSMPMNEVGSSNFALANGMQHRLNRVVNQLKSDS